MGHHGPIRKSLRGRSVDKAKVATPERILKDEKGSMNGKLGLVKKLH